MANKNGSFFLNKYLQKKYCIFLNFFSYLWAKNILYRVVNKIITHNQN
jgi:hypothetical protein